MQDDSERAQQAFEIINRAWKTLENEDTRKKCMDIYQEAIERTDHMVCDYYLYNSFGYDKRLYAHTFTAKKITLAESSHFVDILLTPSASIEILGVDISINVQCCGYL